MSIKEKQSSPTYQNSDFTVYPSSEKEVALFIRKSYKANIPIEISGSNSKKKNWKTFTMCKNFKFIQT